MLVEAKVSDIADLRWWLLREWRCRRSGRPRVMVAAQKTRMGQGEDEVDGETKRPVWSYRVLKQHYEGKGEEPWVEVEYGIVEAYFDEDGEPVGYCDPHVLGNSVEELRSVLAMMHTALDKPILETGDFKGEQSNDIRRE